MNELAQIAQKVYDVAVLAGESILPFYLDKSKADVQYKSDNSPLTAADQAAHEVIHSHLSKMFVFDQVLPVLSEEGGKLSLSNKLEWDAYWCVDPLDGTKEFINGSKEFTVNIALIKAKQPILGVIYAPVLKEGYLAFKQGGAYRCQSNEKVLIKTQVPPADTKRIIVSRRHGIAQIEGLLAKIPEHKRLNRGSALKFCEIAKGSADLFLRTTETCEWDNAAGQCIVEEAGGALFHFDLSAVQYNIELSLKTKPLIVVGDPTYPWKGLFL